MPGSIQVSVLDLKELPSTSNFVKVSLGKVEYEALDKGDFSFPLMTLRDNLIITLYDAERNPIAYADVRTLSIIEKGTWIDLFPLEGGGLIHMKLQFLLGEEERNRIRLMRESAMKKKQDEILNSRLGSTDAANTATNSLSSSLQRHVTSDVLSSTSSQDLRSSIQNNAVKTDQLTNDRDETFKKDEVSGERIKEGTFQSQISPVQNATDRREEAASSSMTVEEELHQKDTDRRQEAASSPMTVEEEVHQKATDTREEAVSSPMTVEEEVHQKALVQDSETRVSEVDYPERSTTLQEASETVLTKKKQPANQKPSDNLAEKLDQQFLVEKIPSDGVGLSKSTIVKKIKSLSMKLEAQPHRQGPLGKGPSNIKKMISAFESSVSQDRGSLLKPQAVKSPSFRVGSARILKNYTEKSESSAQRLRNSFSTGDLQRNITDVIKSGEKILDEDVGESNATKIQSKGMVASLRDRLNSAQLMKKPKLPSEKESFSARKPEERDSFAGEANRTVSPSSEAGTLLETTHEKKASAIPSAVKSETKSMHRETEAKELLKSPEEVTVSGRLDDGRNSASGTSQVEETGKEIPLKNIIDGNHHAEVSKDNLEYFHGESSGTWIFPDESMRLCITAEGDKLTLSSVPETITKDEVHHGTDGKQKQKQVEEVSHESEKSRPKSSDEASYDRPLEKAIKIAVVIGFGVLILLFRQREPRKCKEKENNPALKTKKVFMKKRGTMEEQLRKIDFLRS